MNIITEDNHSLSTPNKVVNINSHSFQQFIQSSPQFNNNTDKNKLFEAFLLFQNIYNLNKHSKIINTSSTLPLTAASSTAKTFDSTIKSEQLPEVNLNTTNEPLVKKELLFLSTEKKPHNNSKDKPTHNPTITKYDDLPIKISNSNYNEPTESKRRVVKSNRNKTLLNISSSNNNNKHYSHYTNDVSKETNTTKHIQQCKQVKVFKSSFIKDDHLDNNINININNTKQNHSQQIKYEQQLEQDIEVINDEINKFKEERKKITILKNEYEKLYLRLQEDFEQLNVKEKEFETYKEIESNKIKTKQKAIDECLKLCNDMKSQNCNLSINAKRDKEQIHALNEQISNMRNEYKQKEINNKILIDKLKKQNEELQTQLQRHLNKRNDLHKQRMFNVNVGNKILIQQNENEEELRLSKRIEECNGENVNNEVINHQHEEIDRLLNCKDDCSNNHNTKVIVNHNPISSYSNINNEEAKVRKLKNKQLTSSTINKDKHYKPNTLYYTKYKNNTSYHNSSSLTNLNSSYKPKHIYNKHSLTLSNKNSLSSLTTPFTSTLPKQPKHKAHNTSNNNNTIIFSYNSLPQDIPHPKPNSKSLSKSLMLPNQSQCSNDIVHYINNNNVYDFTSLEQCTLQSTYTLIKSTVASEGKTVNTYTNNKKEIIYPSGIRKEIYNNEYQIIYFINGDVKQVFPNGVSVYYFKDEQTIQTIFENGLQVFKFQNGQIEKHYPDGTKYITFPDTSTRYVAKEFNDNA